MTIISVSGKGMHYSGIFIYTVKMRLTITVLIKMTYSNVVLLSKHVLVLDVLFQN